jgi:hypothetical protein
MVNIYVLQLEDTSGGYKYYIGKSSNPITRLEQHNNSNGSAWTNKYKPISIVELIPNCDDYDEDKYTLKYMQKYGIDNVRGGSFTQIKLDEDNIKTINRMIKGSSDKCYKCGNDNHFANKCTVILSKVSTKSKCERYNRIGHNIDDCHAATYDNGEKIVEYVKVYCCDYCGKEFDTAKGAIFHENVHCKKKFQKAEKKTKSNKCFRCGRAGHYADSCYANTHVNGSMICDN